MNRDWLIVGLGNPGSKYKMTRHNIGFTVVDKLVDLVCFGPLTKQKGFKAEVGETMLFSKKVVLAKPHTFMNDSGYSVELLSRMYMIPPERILVIYDDVSLDFGRLRYRITGSAGGHNGIKSIITSLENNQDFSRLKIGIGPKPAEGQLIDYVLGDFTEEEQSKLSEVIDNAINAIDIIINSDSSEIAMTRVNKNG